MPTLLIHDIESKLKKEVDELSKKDQKMTIGGWRFYHWLDWWGFRFE
jgi:hypothetical protein